MTTFEAIDPGARTPAGLQARATLARRRMIVATANATIYLALASWLARILAVGGWSLVDIGFFVCFLIASPWGVVGFVNACLGLWLAGFAREGAARTAPFLAAGDSDIPVRERIAVVMTVRNEDPERAISRLQAMEAELSATQDGATFGWHLLSDTSDALVAGEEEWQVAAWRARRPDAAHRIHYRRRLDNAGFKAGNLVDFCAHHCDEYDLMLVLDADSFMRADAILRMARIAQAHPRIGILQSLVVGAPSRSAFARLFQFGMRAGMRSYTLGASWWTGDCGPFWGHNGLVRIKPFLDHCKLPVLRSGPILSHDQIEAALMRRAGYEVRVMPVETASFEENPPDMAEFSRRNVRWCQGNMQYWRLVDLPGLLPVSRFQLVWAIAMFVGLPASQAMLLLAALKPFDGEPVVAFPVASAEAFVLTWLFIELAPKLAGFAGALFGRRVEQYGGRRLFASSAALELVASYLLSAATGLQTALFLLTLPFGKSLRWSAQRRDAGALSWADATAAFWPATAFGAIVLALIVYGAPAAIPWALPFIGGLLVAIPFARLTAAPVLGAFMVDRSLCATPEELDGSLKLNAP